MHLFYYYDKQPHTPHPKRHHRIFRGPTVHRCPTTCAKKHTKGKNVKKEIQSPLNTATLHTFTRNHGFFHRHGTLEHSRRAIPVDASRLDVRVWRATRVVFGQLYARVFLFFLFFWCSMRTEAFVLDYSRKMVRERVVRERHRSERSTLILTRISLLRPPNSRSSRLSPANSRTAPSPRYAFSLWFFIIVCVHFYAKLEKAKVTRDRE